VSAEIDYFMTRCPEADGQGLFQFEPTVIGGNSNTHKIPLYHSFGGGNFASKEAR
jgi:hypothetical protein